MKQPVDTVKHVFGLYKLATVGLLDASLHSCDEAGLIFEHAGNSVFHQLLSVFAIGRGHLLEPRFNVGREMYFHAFQYGKTGAQAMPLHHSPVVSGLPSAKRLHPPPHPPRNLNNTRAYRT